MNFRTSILSILLVAASLAALVPVAQAGPDAGVCARATNGSCPGAACVWTAAKYTCVDPILVCGYVSEGDAYVGVTYHGCTQVDGYVCVPTYMGGGGLHGGFVCRNPATFHLP